jgi:guanine deaminase
LITLYHAQIFDFVENPLNVALLEDSYRYFENGALVVIDGFIKDIGEFDEMRAKYSQAKIVDYTNKLIMPGFIDTHIHFPQMQIIGSFGKQLMDWLKDYTFPVEKQFNNFDYALSSARLFVNELLKNGTTTSVAYASKDKCSADALFTAASEINMRIIAGKVMMNRNAPADLIDTAISAYADSRELIEKWHNQGRNGYAITPRFAIACDFDELQIAGKLHKEFPNTYIQTHLSENRREIEFTSELFPQDSDYLGVYERAGLLTDRTFFAHCIHLSDSELGRIAQSKSIIVHCPSSNLFLGSGLFSVDRANKSNIITTIATDIGAGTSFSLLRTLGDTYKVQQINRYAMPVLEGFYKITKGAAEALQLDDRIGSFSEGNEADFVVIDYRKQFVLKQRMEYLKRTGMWNIESLLFGLQTLGDDRNIEATYLMGKQVSQN